MLRERQRLAERLYTVGIRKTKEGAWAIVITFTLILTKIWHPFSFPGFNLS
jgi:hypothetical protein